MGKNLIKNAIYNTLFQLVSLVIPLATVPYISRVLGAENIGIYNYTLSITRYFIIFGTLGLSLYGSRQIAYSRDNKSIMSCDFWHILFIKSVATCASLFVYYLLFSNNSIYSSIFLIQSLEIIATVFDVSWLFIGLEDFKKIVTRNLIVRVIGIVLVFTLVKQRDDLILYTLINASTVLLSSLVMWFYIPSVVVKSRINFINILIHIKPTIALFLPQIASQVYLLLDKTLLGVLSNVEQVGFYSQAEKIIKAAAGMITSISSVMLPRMSNIFAQNKVDEMNVFLNYNIRLISYISIPVFLGIAGISKEFVPIFFGDGYTAVIELMIVMSPVIYFIGSSSVTGTQYLLASNKIKPLTISILFGVIINLILNIILIPITGASGAVIGTVFAEASVLSVQFVFLRTNIRFKAYIIGVRNYLFAGVIMVGTVRLISLIMTDNVMTIIVQSVLGATVYFVILTLLKDEINISIMKFVRVRLSNIKKRIA